MIYVCFTFNSIIESEKGDVSFASHNTNPYLGGSSCTSFTMKEDFFVKELVFCYRPIIEKEPFTFSSVFPEKVADGKRH